MKTELKAKFLQHLVRKNGEKGFTLIELLVVIIIIGILSAIALPSFLSQAAKARMAEAKNQIGSINRGEQAYFIETGVFTEVISNLGLGLKTNGKNYSYTLAAGTPTEAMTTVSANNYGRVKGYSGGVGTNSNNVMTTAVCETTSFLTTTGAAQPAPTIANGVPDCGALKDIGTDAAKDTAS